MSFGAVPTWLGTRKGPSVTRVTRHLFDLFAVSHLLIVRIEKVRSRYRDGAAGKSNSSSTDGMGWDT